MVKREEEECEAGKGSAKGLGRGLVPVCRFRGSCCCILESDTKDARSVPGAWLCLSREIGGRFGITEKLDTIAARPVRHADLAQDCDEGMLDIFDHWRGMVR